MKTQVFSAILPLVLFWAVEEYFGLKAALIVGCIAAVGEMGWEYWKTKTITKLTLLSNFMVLGLGGVSFVMDSGVAFKLQPMAMEFVMAGVLWWMAYKGTPMMVEMMSSNPMVTPEKRAKIMENPDLLRKIIRVDVRMRWFFMIHGILVGLAAIYGTTRMWILLKGVLFYVLMVLVALPF